MPDLKAQSCKLPRTYNAQRDVPLTATGASVLHDLRGEHESKEV